MIESLQNIFKIKDLRQRVLFTLGILAVYRIGAFVPIPGVNLQALKSWFGQNAGGVFGLVDLFTGGNFQNLTIFALGIMPYISASIILQLLAVVYPPLEALQKEGEVGRRKITQYTRYGTVILSLLQSAGICIWVNKIGGAEGPVVNNPGVGFWITTILTLTTGTAFIMWLGEQITERGIGNGISLIIFAGIVARFPHAVVGTVKDVFEGGKDLVVMVVLGVVMIAVVAAVVFVERAQRRIPIQYASRVQGRRVMRGQATFLPLRVNTAGVIPVIFATSLMVLPTSGIQLLYSKVGWTWLGTLQRQFESHMPYYNLVVFLLIAFFCFFYTAIVFNPVDTAENMKRVGGFIPGVRPGKQTSQYIDNVLTRLTFAGALYLGLIWVLPNFLMVGMKFHQIEPAWLGMKLEGIFPNFILNGFNVNFYFGGTSLLIVVGVAMDTVQQIESQLVMRHYDGFLRGTRIKGRRW